MKRFIRRLKRVRIVFRRSSPMKKMGVLCAVALCMVALLTLSLSIGLAENRTAELTEQAAQLEQENAGLKDKIDALGSADSVEQIAQDELGLIDPDKVIIDPQD